MAYTLAADILAILPGLPQTTTAAGYTATATIITSHVTRSDALIDAKLSRRYSVPFATTSTSTPPVITSISQDITAYYSYRSLFTRDSRQRFEYLDDFYATALKTLDDIALGVIDVVNTAGSVISERNSGNKVYSTTESWMPIFDVDDEMKWKFDSDRLTQINSDRQ